MKYPIIRESKCNHLPIFKADELAKLYYETDLMANGQWGIATLDNRLVVYRKGQENEDNTVSILGNFCPFYKRGKQSCSIIEADYDLLPESCKMKLKNKLSPSEIADRFTDIASLLGIEKNLIVIKYEKDTMRKLLKNLYQDVIYYYLINNFVNDSTLLSLGIEYKKDYKLAIIKEGSVNKVSAVAIHNLYLTEKGKESIPEVDIVESILKGVNKLNNYMIRKPLEYHQIVVDKLNRKLSGLSKTTLDENLIRELEKENKDVNVRGYLRLLYDIMLLSELLNNKQVFKHISKYIQVGSRSLLVLASKIIAKLVKDNTAIENVIDAAGVYNKYINEPIFKELSSIVKSLAKVLIRKD